MRKKRNYSRLYAIAKAKNIDLEQHKEALVSQFTGGRTTSLREMTPAEYEELCECLQTGKQLGETSAAYKERLRKARSAALDRMQRLGVDTAKGTFAAVDAFCRSPRIAGKPFGLLTVEELQALVPKLEAILGKPKPAKRLPQSASAPAQPATAQSAPAQPKPAFRGSGHPGPDPAEPPQPNPSAEPARQASGSPKLSKPETGKSRPTPVPAQPELPQPNPSAEPARQASGSPKPPKPETGKPRPTPVPAQPELPQPNPSAEPARQASGSPKPPAAKGCSPVCDLPTAPSRTSDCTPRHHSGTTAIPGSSGPQHSAHPGTAPEIRQSQKPAETHPSEPEPAEGPGPAAPASAASHSAQPAARRQVVPLLLHPNRPPS